MAAFNEFNRKLMAEFHANGGKRRRTVRGHGHPHPDHDRARRAGRHAGTRSRTRPTATATSSSRRKAARRRAPTGTTTSSPTPSAVDRSRHRRRSPSKRRVATGAERERLYAQHAADATFNDYKKPPREIPVVCWLTARRTALYRRRNSRAIASAGEVHHRRPAVRARARRLRTPRAAAAARAARRRSSPCPRARPRGTPATPPRDAPPRRRPRSSSRRMRSSSSAMSQPDVVAGERRRHRAHDVRRVAEVLDLEPQPLRTPRACSREQRPVRRRQLERQRLAAAPARPASAARAAARKRSYSTRSCAACWSTRYMPVRPLRDDVHVRHLPHRAAASAAARPSSPAAPARRVVGARPLRVEAGARQRRLHRAVRAADVRLRGCGADPGRCAAAAHSPPDAAGTIAVRRQRPPHRPLQHAEHLALAPQPHLRLRRVHVDVDLVRRHARCRARRSAAGRPAACPGTPPRRRTSARGSSPSADSRTGRCSCATTGAAAARRRRRARRSRPRSPAARRSRSPRAATSAPYTAASASMRLPLPVVCSVVRPSTRQLEAHLRVRHRVVHDDGRHLRRFAAGRRAGTSAAPAATQKSRRTVNIVPGGVAPAPSSTISPSRSRMRAPTSLPAVRASAASTSPAAAMLGSASPRNPSVAMRQRSSSRGDLARRVPLERQPQLARLDAAAVVGDADQRQPALADLDRDRACAPASSEFSISSLTTEAGRSMTSPAAIFAASCGARMRIGIPASFARS